MAVVVRLTPPNNERPVTGDGQHTQAWAGFFRGLTDQLATVHRGVTDGSEANAGEVGEYMTASASLGLANNTTTNVVSLSLTAGDWDVSGTVTFTITGAASSHYGAGIDVLGMQMITTVPTGSGAWILSAGAPVRRNITATTTVWLVANAGFTSGSVAAAGTITARRMR
jgi:hypothetical protein